MGETRILLADDHAVLRQGLRRIIEDHDGWRVVGEAANGRDAVTAAEALQTRRCHSRHCHAYPEWHRRDARRSRNEPPPCGC